MTTPVHVSRLHEHKPPVTKSLPSARNLRRAAANILFMTAQILEQPAAASVPGKLWEVKVGGAAGLFLSTPRKAAERIAATAERRLAQGRPIMFTVFRLDDEDNPEWDASAAVAGIFAATGWPAVDCQVLRAYVVDVLEAVLVQGPMIQ